MSIWILEVTFFRFIFSKKHFYTLIKYEHEVGGVPGEEKNPITYRMPIRDDGTHWSQQ